MNGLILKKALQNSWRWTKDILLFFVKYRSSLVRSSQWNLWFQHSLAY